MEVSLAEKDKRFLTLDDLTNLPAPSWMIDGLFESNSLVMLAGPSYSFKSFLLLDWLMNMASGRSWLGRPTQPAKIVYALGEGKSSLMKRITAWAKYNKLTDEERAKIVTNFRVTFDVPQLATKSSVDNFLSELATDGFTPDLIAVDTFARSFVGKNENDAMDVGIWVDQADRLRQLGYGVIFLHHTKKNTEFGVHFRGSTAIMGAMDTAMTLIRNDETCTLTVTKQKDHDEGKPMRFRRLLVPISKTESSVVLVPTQPIIKVGTDGDGPIDEGTTLMTSDEINAMSDELMGDVSFESDAQRAEILSQESGLTLNAARMRLNRAKKPEGTIKKVKL